jgi:hypothetical protein
MIHIVKEEAGYSVQGLRLFWLVFFYPLFLRIIPLHQIGRGKLMK